MAIIVLIGAVAVLVGFVVFYVYLIDLVVIGHDFASTNSAISGVAQIVKRYHKESGVFFDLGSSRGGFIFRILRHCPRLRVTGVDNSGLRILLSRAVNLLLGQKVKFLKNNVLLADVSAADCVYIYLGTWMMEGLEQKLAKELKPGAIVITNTQFFPTWQPVETIITRPNKPEYEKLFVYIK